MAEIKILLLCNNTIAIPALQEMLFFKQVAAVVIPAKNKTLLSDLEELMKGTGVPLLTIDRKNFKKVIRREIDEKKVEAVLMMTFPYLVPAELLNIPPKGFINFHYGKLPEYRGPEPIFMQVVMQEKKPGLTIHLATDGIDEGPIVLQESIPYDAEDTYGQLQSKLADTGAKMVRVLLKILSFGSILPTVHQDESLAAYHKKPTAATLMINWEKMESAEIRALVNACNPWNKGCGARIGDRVIGITEVDILEHDTVENDKPGTVVELDDSNGLLVQSCDGRILRINIFYTELGFMSGKKLARLGVRKGNRFV